MTDEIPAVNHVLLEIQIPDFDLAKKFYGQLGFRKIWERQPEGFKEYLIMKLEDNILCFWGERTRLPAGIFFKIS